MKKKKKEIKEEGVRIRKVASFGCMYWENVSDIGMSLAKAGRFVNIYKTSGEFRVEIYERF